MTAVAGAAIEISIAAHYVPRRVPFLVAALEAIGRWERPDVRVTIATNDLALAEEPLLADTVAKVNTRGYRIDFDRAHSMAHPFHLTWWHKQRLREWSQEPGNPRDLFMYIEDDMAITEANLAYFERYLPAAKAIGCIPGFVVYENSPDGTLIAQGFRGSHLVQPNEFVTLDGQLFVAPRFPYWPGFIMDRELAAEYWRSPWSDMAQAEKMPQAQRHTCRVHSAWALAYDQVPAGQTSRYIVPVDDQLVPLPESLALHAAGNYSVAKTHSFGTVPIEKAFRRPSMAARLANRQWRLHALLRRILRKLARMLTPLKRD